MPSPAENLACDEALLDSCEAGQADELLRFWEPTQHFVVLGYANKASSEVALESCKTARIPVLRRCTGGGTVLQGPGCLNYSLILRIDDLGPLRSITATNDFILKRHAVAFSRLLGLRAERQGQTDLAIENLKFSGNAQRRKKRFLLYHGTFLLNFDLTLIEKALKLPSEQPAYRKNRPHLEFLMNLRVPADEIKSAIAENWGAAGEFTDIPSNRIHDLVQQRYSLEIWNFRF